jgi:hypothetical protein
VARSIGWVPELQDASPRPASTPNRVRPRHHAHNDGILRQRRPTDDSDGAPSPVWKIHRPLALVPFRYSVDSRLSLYAKYIANGADGRNKFQLTSIHTLIRCENVRQSLAVVISRAPSSPKMPIMKPPTLQYDLYQLNNAGN